MSDNFKPISTEEKYSIDITVKAAHKIESVLQELRDKSHERHMNLISDVHRQLKEIDNKEVG